MPDDWCVTAYTAAELPLLLASPKAGKTVLKISSRHSRRLLGTSTSPVSILSQFSHVFFSSLGRCRSQGTRASYVSLYSIFPAKVTGEANPKWSYILDTFLRISLLVTLTVGAGKATSIVSTVLFHGALSSLVSPFFTSIWYSSTVVGCFPVVSSSGVARLWLASSWVVECCSAAFSEDGGSSRDGTFECHFCSLNLPSLKIAKAAFFSTTVVTPVIRSSTWRLRLTSSTSFGKFCWRFRWCWSISPPRRNSDSARVDLSLNFH